MAMGPNSLDSCCCWTILPPYSQGSRPLLGVPRRGGRAPAIDVPRGCLNKPRRQAHIACRPGYTAPPGPPRTPAKSSGRNVGIAALDDLDDLDDLDII
jgi:hypothetical protein